MSRKGFWNWLKLPNIEDINAISDGLNNQEQYILDIKQQQSELVKQLDNIKSDLTLLTARFSEIQKLQQDYSDNIVKSNSYLKSIDNSINDIKIIEKDIFDMVKQEAQNQNSLLRILIINSLSVDIEELINNYESETISNTDSSANAKQQISDSQKTKTLTQDPKKIEENTSIFNPKSNQGGGSGRYNKTKWYKIRT